MREAWGMVIDLQRACRLSSGVLHVIWEDVLCCM